MRNETLLAGMPEETFWNISLGEARRWMMAHNKREKERLRQQAYLLYQSASLHEISVARGLGEEVEFPHIGKVYPGLFDSEKIEAAIAEERQRRDVEKFIALTEQWNEDFRRNHGRETESSH